MFQAHHMRSNITDWYSGAPVQKVGKSVRGDLYLHTTALNSLSDCHTALVERSISIAKSHLKPEFNVVKIGRDGRLVSLLLYPRFFADAFPTLAKSTTIDTTGESVRTRTYNIQQNPPILHKKELLLGPSHPNRHGFELLTKQLEIRNLKPNKPGLGFKRQWETYLGIMGVAVKNHQLMDL